MFFSPGVYEKIEPEKYTTPEEEINYLVKKHNELEYTIDDINTRKNIENIIKALEQLLLLHPDLSYLVKLKKWKTPLQKKLYM